MAGFADMLAPELASVPNFALGPMPPAAPAIPPPRQPDSKFARFMGLGASGDAAYQKGIEAVGQAKYRSAQTESALAEAEERRNKAMRESQGNALRAKIAADPKYMLTVSEMALLANSANDFASSMLGYQEYQQRGGIADLLTPQDQRLANMEAVSGRPVERFYDSGTGMQASQLTPAAAPTVTPVGQAQINNERPAGGGGFTSGGVRYGADGQPIVDVDVAAANAAKMAEAVARGRTGGKESTVTLPAKVRQAVAENDGLIAGIKRAIALVEQNPESFGLKYGLGDAVNQRLDPNGVVARAAVADIGSAKLHDRSGAAITAKEFPRLTPFIAAVTDRSDAILAKLNGMLEAVTDEQGALQGLNQPAPAVPGAGAPAGGIAPKTQAEYDALPPGTVYIDTDGQRKRKR